MKIRFTIVFLSFLILSNCASKMTNKVTEDVIGDVIEIAKYSNFKNFINKDLEIRSIKKDFVYGNNIRKIGYTECNKYFYPKKKELVYVEYFIKSDSIINEKFYYRDNILVLIKTNIINQNNDTISQRIFLRNKKILFPRKSNSNRIKSLINKGIEYLNNFDFQISSN